MSGQPGSVTRILGSVGIIELARPEKSNCLSTSVFRDIEAAVNRFEEAGSGVRSVLICAHGKNFCAGADLEEVKAMGGDSAKLKEYLAFGHKVLQRLEASDLPVVAACQGLVLAGGSELILACDIIFSASDARFGDQHAQYGLLPGWGGSQRLPRVIGLRRGLDLFFSARWIDAATALNWGLVNYVVDPAELNGTALEYCAKIATRSPSGIAAMKRLARSGLDGSLSAGLQLEQDVAGVVLNGPNAREGLAAFEERRPPRFGG